MEPDEAGLSEAVGGALAEHARKVDAVGPQAWTALVGTDGTGVEAAVRLDEGRLSVRVPAGEPPRRNADELLWTLMELHRAWCDPCKYVLRGHRMELCWESLPGGRSDARRDVARACAMMASAPTRTSPKAIRAEPRRRGPCGPGRSQAGLADLVRDAGWPCHETPAGRLTVRLEVQGSFRLAAIARGPSGAPGRACSASGAEAPGSGTAADASPTSCPVRVWTELMGAGIDRISPTSRLAAAVMLLGVGVVHRARPYVERNGRGARLGLEVLLGADPSAADLDEALGALSVACDLALDVRSLAESEELAGHYLAVGGWGA